MSEQGRSDSERHRREGRADAFVALTQARTLPLTPSDHLLDVLGVSAADVEDALARLRCLTVPGRRKPGPDPKGKRWCPSCAMHRRLDAFTVDRSRPSGLSGWCRECHNLRRDHTPAAPSFAHRFPRPAPDSVVDAALAEADKEGVALDAILNGEPCSRAVTAARRRLVRRLRGEGHSPAELAEWFNTSTRTIHRATAEAA